MINFFISALMAIFILRRSSKEVREKTKRSSGLRTIIYLFLTIIFAVIYYRSFQVSTIINRIEISSLRGAEDSCHRSTDTIDNISILNDIKTLDSYRNPIFDAWDNDTNYLTGGAVEINFSTSDTLERIVKDRPSLTAEIKKEIDSLSGQTINCNKGPIYNCTFFSTSIPNLVSFYPAIRYDTPIVEDDSLYFIIKHVGNVLDSIESKIMICPPDPANHYFYEALAYQQTIITKTDRKLGGFGMPHHLFNTIDIFTAADLSQYTYCLELFSDMHIKNIDVNYNVPIEISIQSKGLIIHTNAFSINDEDVINDNNNGGVSMMFHVKLPTMANLQQIRSLILTAIVTALFSLFCTNLYYWLRKKALIYIIKKHRINISGNRGVNRSDINNIRHFFYIIVFVCLLLVLIYVSMKAFGFAFLIDYEKDGWRIAIKIIFLIILVSVSAYFIAFKLDTLIKMIGNGKTIKGYIQKLLRHLKKIFNKASRDSNVISDKESKRKKHKK